MKTKILVIEDEMSIRLGTTTLLGTTGLYEVMEAENGKQGVEVATEFKPDLIICDVNMPELDGYGVLDSIRNDSGLMQTPFIFLTANASRNDVRRGMESGADDYLIKPFKKDELFNAVNKRLEKARQQQEVAERRLTELRSNISHALPHELLTPLIGIIGSSDILVHHASDLTIEDIKESGSVIKESAIRLQHTIENYIMLAHLQLALTNADAVHAMQSERTTHPSFLIREIISKLCRVHSYNQDTIYYNPINNCSVVIGEQLLWKAVEELISNAIKFSTPTSRIDIVERVEENKWHLTITNVGIGMTQEQIRNVGAFMQFNRKSNEQQGSGLGLAIASVICRLHDGTLDIESIPDKTTTVTLSLPLSS